MFVDLINNLISRFSKFNIDLYFEQFEHYSQILKYVRLRIVHYSLNNCIYALILTT